MSDPANIVQQALSALSEGRGPQAQALLTRALQKHPGHPGLNQVMAIIASKLDRPDQAVYYIDRALASDPSSATLWHHKALLLTNTPRRHDAEASLRRAVELEPDLVEAWEHLGILLADLDKPGEAQTALAEAMRRNTTGAIRPAAAMAYARVLAYVGRVPEAIKTLHAVPGGQSMPEVAAQLAMLSHYTGEYSAKAIADLHRRLGALLPSPKPRVMGHVEPHRKIRVGLVSSDFREHSVASFARAIVEFLPRDAFEVFSYSTGGKVDDVTRWFEQMSDVWRPVSGLDDTAMGAIIERDRIDVMIDLIGLSAQPRLALLASRPAPVVLTAIGYPNTTGILGVTHRLVDAITDPPGAESLCVERLVRLDGCFLCYSPPADAPDVQALSGTDRITFGSFNNLAKLSDQTLALWSRILQRVPDSRLVLKARGLQDASVREAWASRLVAHGMDRPRVELQSPRDLRADHLRTYESIHIALDPMPYAGTTTTCEALWMGVPVVTLPGGADGSGGHASRVSASLLQAVGLERGIASSAEDYVDRAVSMAQDPAWLDESRRTLRDRVRASVLCDSAAYGRRLGQALRDLWREACGA